MYLDPDLRVVRAWASLKLVEVVMFLFYIQISIVVFQSNSS